VTCEPVGGAIEGATAFMQTAQNDKARVPIEGIRAFCMFVNLTPPAWSDREAEQSRRQEGSC
jgi:hypothetical protein